MTAIISFQINNWDLAYSTAQDTVVNYMQKHSCRHLVYKGSKQQILPDIVGHWKPPDQKPRGYERR